MTKIIVMTSEQKDTTIEQVSGIGNMVHLGAVVIALGVLLSSWWIVLNNIEMLLKVCNEEVCYCNPSLYLILKYKHFSGCLFKNLKWKGRMEQVIIKLLLMLWCYKFNLQTDNLNSWDKRILFPLFWESRSVSVQWKWEDTTQVFT